MSYLQATVDVEIPYREISDDDILDIVYHRFETIKRLLSADPPRKVSSALIELYEELAPILRNHGVSNGDPLTLEDELKQRLLNRAFEQMTLTKLEEVLEPHLK